MSFLSDWWPATSPSALSPSMNSGFRAVSRNSGPKGSPRRARGLSLSKAAESEAFVISGCYDLGYFDS